MSEDGEGVQSSGGAEAVERVEEVVGVGVGDGCGMEEVLVWQAGLAAGWGEAREGGRLSAVEHTLPSVFLMS